MDKTRNITRITRTLLDRRIFFALQNLQIVETGQDFSCLLNKSQNYFSSLQARRQPVSVKSLMILNQKLREAAQNDRNHARKIALNRVIDDLNAEISERLC
jgi:hypothetical protein